MTDKMKDTKAMSEKLLILSKLDPFAFGKACGMIEQAERDESRMREMEAQLAALSEKRAG